MSIRVATADRIDGKALEFLLDNNTVHQADEDELTDPAMHALTLMDNGEMIIVCAYMIVQRGQYRDLEIIAANTKALKGMKWLKPLMTAFEQLADVNGCRGVKIPVGRPALQSALEKLGYMPWAMFLAK